MGDHLVSNEVRCPEEMTGLAVAAARQGRSALEAALQRLPAPVYTADADGFVTFFNEACIGFTGRTPAIGKDRWCVTWRLYTSDGAPLAHEDCPMALAIRQGRAIRDVVAIAERPDGSRVIFAPYPTPLLDASGRPDGAVNILIDVTEQHQADELRAQAMRCRRLARTVTDRRTLDTLLLMAREYDEKVRSLSHA